MDRAAWLTLGLQAVKDGGAPALRLEEITARAGKTRGSFYHHFKSSAVFITEMMALWRKTHTDDLIAAAERAPDKAEALNTLAAALDHGLERALRRLAEDDPARRSDVAAVDEARIEYLRTVQPDPNSDAAKDYALVEYAAFLGVQALSPDAPPERFEKIGVLMAEMISAHWNE